MTHIGKRIGRRLALKRQNTRGIQQLEGERRDNPCSGWEEGGLTSRKDVGQKFEEGMFSTACGRLKKGDRVVDDYYGNS